jgi:hypothetical protein
LVRNPKILHALERIRKHDPPVTQTDLEDWAVFLAPFVCYFGMVLTELGQVSEYWISGDLWESLDFRDICPVHDLDSREDDCNEEER